MKSFKSKITFSLKFFLVVTCIYYGSQMLAFFYETPESYSALPKDEVHSWYMDHSLKTKSNHSCIPVHLLLHASLIADTHQLSTMLQTLLFHRRRPLHFHIIASESVTYTLKILIDTWDLNDVQTDFYKLETEEALVDDHPFSLIDYLPTSIKKVIVINRLVYLLNDVGLLWDLFDKFSSSQNFAAVPNTQTEGGFHPDLMIFNMEQLRSEVHSAQVPNIKHLMWNKKPAGKGMYAISCLWGVRLEEKFDFDACVGSVMKRPQALVHGPLMKQFSRNGILENLKEYVTLITLQDFSSVALIDCGNSKPQINYFPKKFKHIECSEFPYATKLKRKTHLYYLGHQLVKSEEDPFDVTLVTQLTVDRFGVLEKMLTSWEGPASVVFHVKPHDLSLLNSLYSKSKVLESRTNVAFHLVYRRGDFYPINYLRNVGVNESKTPYTIFIDVDLVPNTESYQNAKKYIQEWIVPDPKVALVIPSFEAMEDIPKFPDTKDDLLQLMKLNKTIAYRMNRGWNVGHKPTNFTKWYTATKPYEAIWKDAFEPYTILRTDMMPQYNEDLFERMGDKIAFGRELHARGFKFLVMPDQFVIHLMHPLSEGTNTWISVPHYQKCGSALFEEFRARLKAEYPDVKF